MDYYAGLDASLEETSVCVLNGDGAVVHEPRHKLEQIASGSVGQARLLL